jgi:hypothetical protein
MTGRKETSSPFLLYASGRKSPSCWITQLRILEFDPAEGSELPDHSRGACLPRLFSDRWAAFFVTDSLMQDQPDQPTLSMGDHPDSLIMSQARDGAATGNLDNMRRELAPSRSETKLDNLICASSSRDATWFGSRARSRVN